MDKINKPCFFYNTGGCYRADGAKKSAAECKYLHVDVNEPLEKPQHLKPPCKYYQLRRHCTNPFCIFGHSELSAERWARYFPSHPWPGVNYLRENVHVWDTTRNCCDDSRNDDSRNDNNDDDDSRNDNNDDFRSDSYDNSRSDSRNDDEGMQQLINEKVKKKVMLMMLQLLSEMN